MEVLIVWHRRDLRIHDNRALYKALEYASLHQDVRVLPVFIIDPFFFRADKLDSDERILFMLESLEDLQELYEVNFGLKLNLIYGNSLHIIKKLQQKLHATVYYNFDSAMIYGFKRDSSVKNTSKFKGFSNDAIVRGASNSRINWSEHAQAYFEESQYSVPKQNFKGVALKNQVNLEDLKEKFNLQQCQEKWTHGGETYALKRLHSFLVHHLNSYPSSISSPLFAAQDCSRLSAHFSLGCLSLRRAYQETQNYEGVSKRTKQFFITRLFWNLHFTQKLEDFPQASELSINPTLRNLHKNNTNEEFQQAWRKGKTGFPLVDASMRYLRRTGWLNFRMRAMLASFYSFILKQYWKSGADFMHRQLLDADIAINYQQWQMQSGLVGVHPLRIYNPTKQIFDNDPRGEFIRAEVEELSKIQEVEWLAEPYKYFWQIKEKYDFDVREVYPKPVVDFEEESKKTRAFFKEEFAKIRAALGLPEVQKHASLSKSKRGFSKKKKKQSSKKNSSKNSSPSLDEFF